MSKSPNRALATTAGVIYLMIGVFGVAATNSATLFGSQGGYLFDLFEVNIAANALHVIIALGLIIVGASSTSAARRLNTIVGVFFLVIGVVGLLLGDSTANILATNVATDVLHLATALLLLVTALGAERPAPRAIA
ncbi:hypothetical protein BH11ACT2_BH11ACT2_06510 [soil metagenome]